LNTAVPLYLLVFAKDKNGAGLPLNLLLLLLFLFVIPVGDLLWLFLSPTFTPHSGQRVRPMGPVAGYLLFARIASTRL
jgi:hypothetical protein